MLIQYVDSLRSLEAIRHAMPRLEAAAIPFPFLLPSPLRGRRAGDEGAERDQISCDEMRWVEPLTPRPALPLTGRGGEGIVFERVLVAIAVRWGQAPSKRRKWQDAPRRATISVTRPNTSRDAQASGWKCAEHGSVCHSSTRQVAML